MLLIQEFILSPTRKIFLESDVPLSKIHCCTQANFAFSEHTETIVLSKYSVREHLTRLCALLTQTLENKNVFPPTIYDIGYLYNEDTWAIYNLNGEPADPTISELLDQCQLWAGRYSSWIYNDNKNNIIFAITPSYPYHWTSAEENPKYVPYQEWIKTYKPCLITTIPHDIARQWIAQAQPILDAIERNIREEFNLPEKEKQA